MRTLGQMISTSFFLLTLLFPASRVFAQDQCEEVQLRASDRQGGDHFGSVALHGNFAAVGAAWDDNDTGSVYLFKEVGGTWIEQTKLVASDRTSGDIFGEVVALGWRRVVVGAPFKDDPANLSGSVYVFTPDGGNAFVETKLHPSDLVQDQQFGTSVATAADRIVVGARGDQMAGYAAGAAYIFRLEESGWIEETKLISQDIQPFDIFGVSVAIGGRRVAVGALGAQANGVRVGAVYVFRKDDAGWIQEAKLVANDPHELDFLGGSVAISTDGERIIAGAVGNEAAYVFRCSGSSWVQEAKLVAGDGSFGEFGTSVAISNPYAAVGAPYGSRCDASQ